MNITKKQFERYDAVQRTGMVNPFNVRLICAMSGLNKAQVDYIMENYQELFYEYVKSI